MIYLRYVTGTPVEGMDARAGFLTAAYALRDDPELPGWAADYLEELLAWFRENLPIPEDFTRSAARHREVDHSRGLSWFKGDAGEVLDKVAELIALLDQFDHVVEQIETERPGYIVYDDDWQVVADPFADTPR